MIKRRSCQSISSNTSRFSRIRHLRVSLMAAAASNFMLGQRDINMCFRRLSSNLPATTSAIDLSKGRIFSSGFRLKSCSDHNYSNILRNNNDLKNNCVGGNEVLKARAYGPPVPELLRVSEEVVKTEKQRQSRTVNGGTSANRGNSAGALDQPSPEKIMIAVDVDEGNWCFIICWDLKILFFFLCWTFAVRFYDLFRWTLSYLCRLSS